MKKSERLKKKLFQRFEKASDMNKYEIPKIGFFGGEGGEKVDRDDFP